MGTIRTTGVVYQTSDINYREAEKQLPEF